MIELNLNTFFGGYETSGSSSSRFKTKTKSLLRMYVQVDFIFGNICLDYSKIVSHETVFWQLLENGASNGFKTWIRLT